MRYALRDLFPLLPSFNYEFIAIFFLLSGFFAQRRFPPRGLRMLEADALAAFTSAMRMINRVHRRTADGWPDAFMPVSPGLSDSFRAVFKIAHLPDSRITFAGKQPYLSGGHFYLGSFFIYCRESGTASGRSYCLSASRGKKFDVGDDRSDGYIFNLGPVAGFDRSAFG